MVSFCNDVDVASREAWVAAVQYFGTRGFFPGYDARPRDPLGRRTASIWLQAALRAGSGDYDPMRTVRELHALTAAEDQPVASDELRRDLDRTLPAARSAAGIELPEAVTRGDFCRLLFDLAGSGAG